MAVLRWLLPLIVVALLLPAGSASAATGGIVLTMSNAKSANKILVWSRATDGSLTFAGRYAAGGRGTGGPLSNQGGLALSADGQWLYAVNAGSDTLAVFRVAGTTITRTDVEPSRGDKPVSVAVHGTRVYVLNAGGKANVRGFTRDAQGRLTLISGSQRRLSAAQPTPAQIGVDPSGASVFVSERATDRLTRFAVGSGGALGPPQWSSSAGGEPFGFDFAADGTLVVSEAGHHVNDGSSASSYRLAANGSPTPISAAVPTTETAACWTVVTPDGRFAYVTNTPDHSISGFALAGNGALTILDADGRTAATGAGSLPIDIDASADSRFLYVLAAGTDRILVYAIGGDGSLSAGPGVGGLPGAANGLVAR